MFQILRDSLNLIKDTFLFLNSVVLNSFWTNSSVYIQKDSNKVFLKPLELNSVAYFDRIVYSSQNRNYLYNYENNNYDFEFSGNAFWKFSISQNLEQGQGISTIINGNYNSYKISGVIKSQVQNRTISIEEIEESYLIVKNNNFSSKFGTFLFKNFRIFGLNFEKNDLFGTFGYEKAQWTKNEIYLDENNRGPYRFSESYNIVSGSVKVYLNGEKMNEDDYIINYQSGTITFKPNIIVKKGDKLTIEYQFFELDGQKEHLFFGYKNFSLYQRRKILRYESDTIKYIESAGYYPSYYKSNNGSYVRKDSIFVYVGEGKGDYVVRFSPFLGGSYNFNGNFYYFVGKGLGNYEPLEYYEPPTIERELNVGFLNNQITIFEFNKNYYKYKYGDFDFEGKINFNYKNFEFGLKRRKKLISDFQIDNNLMFQNFGNYLYLKFLIFEPYVLDSLFGFKVNHKMFSFESISNRRKFHFNLNNDIFEFEYNYFFIDSSFNRVSFKTKTLFYPIYNLRIRRDIENEVGFGINANLINFIMFYNVQKQNYQFRAFKSSSNLNFDINYILEPDVIYVEKFIYVGEGLGDYSYDAKSNTYYRDSYGSYIKQNFPIYLKGTNSQIIGNLLFNYKSFNVSISRSKENLFFGVSYENFNFSYNKQLNYEELNNNLRFKIFTIKNKYVYQNESFNYLKNSFGFFFSKIDFGFGFYGSKTLFLYFEYKGFLSVSFEYRFSDYSGYVKSGLDLISSINHIFNFKNYNIVVFGIFGYNNLRTIRNFGVNLMLRL